MSTGGLQLNHDALLAKVRNAALDGLNDVGQFVAEQSARIVPFDEGDLADSVAVETGMDGESRAYTAVSYNTPYALAQHENTDFKHAPGRTDHYLTKTVEENQDRIKTFLADALRKAT